MAALCVPFPPRVLCAIASKEANIARKKPAVDWGCHTYSRENAKLLQEWLSAQGLPPQKLALEMVDAGGRGLVAQRSVRRGEKLLYVPSSLIITTESEWSNPQAGDVLTAEGLSEWPFLASYLISEASLGTMSRWNAYISALPRQPGSILQWSLAEVNKYLSASPTRDQALERITAVEDTYRAIHLSIYSKHPHLFPGKFFTLESFKWAFGILFSRLVRLPSLDQRVALVPWADMLNHSSKVHAFLDFEISSKAVILATDQAYQPLEEVFISYGHKSNGELLLSYGFIPSDYNVDDSVDLLLAIDYDDEMYAVKLEALKQHGLSSSCRYPLRISGLPLQLIAFAHLAVCPPSSSSHFSEMAAVAAMEGGGIQGRSVGSLFSVSLDIEIKAYELILATCEAALLKVSKFLEANKQVIDGDLMKGDESKQASRHVTKTKMACDLCIGEQRILYRTQTVIRSKLQELRSMKASGEKFSVASRRSSPGLLQGLQKFFK